MEVIKVWSTHSKSFYDLIIIKEKENGQYRIVNLTKQWLCPCKFDSYDAAYDDIRRYEKEGRNQIELADYYLKVIKDED